ncbi:MAG: SDR family oxidoreductase [Spirochaetes bacterium]|nr:SDR family oxidoreductase [Spirochaetota bacterium]
MAIKNLHGKKCLVTGAASGIGKATALKAAREGAELFITDINEASLKAVADECTRLGVKVTAKALDISSYDAVKSWAMEIHSQHTSLDVLMNIAGIAIWGTVENMTHDEWRRVIDINLMGPVHVIECFIPPMIAAKRGGHLVNVSSAAGLFGLPWHAAYSASKFGLRGISEVLRFDLERHNIGVSLVCPGGVDSGLVNTIQVAGIDTSDPEFTKLREGFAKRAVTPEQAAEAILKGIRDNRYMVFTSADIAIGHWFQNKFSPPYEIVMRIMNRVMGGVMDNQKKKGLV